MYHVPVLLKEAVDGLNIQDGGTYVDVTFGGGGHSREILKRMKGGRLIAFDKDSDAARNTWHDERLTLIKQDFKFMRNFLRMHEALPVDGILADLGVSSHQFDDMSRGFSFRGDARLDMRMDRSAALDASKVLNEYDEQELYRIFRNYGELKNARRLAAEVVAARIVKPVETVSDLVAIADSCKPRKAGKNYMAQVFQSIRIEVNDELGALKALMADSASVIRKGGRFVVITYHSLEDRLVKNYFRTGDPGGKLEKDFYGNVIRPFDPVNRKVITPGEEEVEKNPRARSAKMRIAERNGR